MWWEILLAFWVISVLIVLALVIGNCSALLR
jgi:hypothetical protein